MATGRFGFIFGVPTAGVFMIELISERETVVRTSADESSDWHRFGIATSRCDEEHSALTLQQRGEKKNNPKITISWRS